MRMKMDKELLRIRNFSKTFGELTVLKDISFSVKEGEVVSIIGPSGSGKTTLLRCAALLETVEKGDLSYGELAVCTQGIYATKQILKEAKNFFGFVFQNFNLFPHYNVWENITQAPLLVQKRQKEEVEKTAWSLLQKMGLSGKEKAYPCELSGGQQQRVAIARALAMKPRILFFDEPTSALDPELTQEILKVIRDLAEEKMTMVIVTHEIGFARNVSDRIIFMADGVIVEEGDASTLVDSPQNERTKEFLAFITSKEI